MSTTAPKPATTPIPVQLSEPEFEAFILPHLSMPKRGVMYLVATDNLSGPLSPGLTGRNRPFIRP